MYVDSNLEFCDATDVSAAVGTAVAGDVVDLGANAVNPGRGEVMYLVIQVTTAFTTGTTAEAQFKLSSDSVAALTTSPTDHWISQALDTGALPLGKTFIVPLPQGVDYERYLGIRVTTTSATTTAGAINAFLTLTPQNWADYADAVN